MLKLCEHIITINWKLHSEAQQFHGYLIYKSTPFSRARSNVQQNERLLLTQPEATWSQSALVPGAGVLIGGDWHQLQNPLSTSSVDALRPKVHQDQVVVSPPWNIQHSRWERTRRVEGRVAASPSPSPSRCWVGSVWSEPLSKPHGCTWTDVFFGGSIFDLAWLRSQVCVDVVFSFLSACF